MTPAAQTASVNAFVWPRSALSATPPITWMRTSGLVSRRNTAMLLAT